MKPSTLVLTGLAAILLTSQAISYTGEEFGKDAKISLKDARELALKARPGTIVDQELEREAGGSGLRFSFDIKSKGVIYEVGVDAKSTLILENQPEGANPD
jgi:uncharacterized membrane protein YkoI